MPNLGLTSQEYLVMLIFGQRRARWSVSDDQLKSEETHLVSACFTRADQSRFMRTFPLNKSGSFSINWNWALTSGMSQYLADLVGGGTSSD